MTFSVPSSEEELEKAVASITNGECEDIIRQKRLLESIRSKKLQHIEAVKAAQMRNLNDIYEYEVEEANSTFKVLYISYCLMNDLSTLIFSE